MAFYTTQGGETDGPVLILAHGAGAPADSPFMVDLAEQLGRQGITTVRFEFPYMVKRRNDAKKRPPDRQPVLLEHFEKVLKEVSGELSAGRPVFIGGKSMGGRMASLLAAQARLEGSFRGVVCFGYPFHPPGKPDRWRTAHFGEFWCPVCVVQGTRDPFGKRDEVESEVPTDPNLKLVWLEGGNHDLRPLARQPESPAAMLELAAGAAAAFIQSVLAGSSY
ncbi:MAG: alpha/beta family hydrolase [Pseudomonadota bacterium]